MQRELVERAQQGDREAFAVLASAAIGRLDAAARLILRDPDSAKDAVQEAFIRAWRELPGLRDPDRFEPWLRRLVVNACLDEARRRRRRPIVTRGYQDGCRETKRPEIAIIWFNQAGTTGRLGVRGHEKVPTGGHVEVPTLD